MSTIPSPFPYRGVSFDMDGTLYSLERFMIQLLLRRSRDIVAWRAMERARRSIRRQRAQHDDVRGMIVEKMAANLGLKHDEVSALIERFIDDDWPALLRRVGPFKGIRPLLSELVDAKVAIVLVSDYPGRGKAEGLGLVDLPWVDILDATDFGALKPRPEVFEAALSALGLPAAEVLHVGDSAELDVTGAVAVGMDTALVKRPPPPPEGEPWPDPTYAFSSVPKFCRAARAALSKR